MTRPNSLAHRTTWLRSDFFKSPEDAIADKQIQNARAIGGYKTERYFSIPGGWDYYEVVFDKNGIAVSQKIATQFDGP